MPERRLSLENSYRTKTEYFNAFAQKYLPEMRLLFKGGKLTRREQGVSGKKLNAGDRANWVNVVEHCLTEVAAAETLSKELGLSPSETEELCRASAVHDFDKRRDKKPDQFNEADNAEIERLYEKINPSEELLFATNEKFFKAFFNNQTNFLQRVQRYVDEICDESDIIDVPTRMQKAAPRAPKLSEKWQPEVTKLLGPDKNYWEAELIMSAQIQKELFDRLVERGVKLEKPEDLPAFIKTKILENYGG